MQSFGLAFKQGCASEASLRPTHTGGNSNPHRGGLPQGPSDPGVVVALPAHPRTVFARPRVHHFVTLAVTGPLGRAPSGDVARMESRTQHACGGTQKEPTKKLVRSRSRSRSRSLKDSKAHGHGHGKAAP